VADKRDFSSERINDMFIVVSKPCCERKPFEPHKENCYFKQLKRARAVVFIKLLESFEQTLQG